METSVFTRTESSGEIVSDATYNLIIGLVLCWGFLVNWLMVANIPVASIKAISPLIFFIGYFASCFFGVYLFEKLNNPLVSFIGYNFVVVPFGFIINIVVSKYDSALVLEAIKVTGMVTVVMMMLGSMYPKFFAKISGALSMALLAVIIIELIQLFFFNIHHDIIDWVVVLIFCGYIGYDWGLANNIPKTIDNAVDSAAALYIDIINLFLRILRILASRRS